MAGDTIVPGCLIWEFQRIPESSLDFVVNVNSLPEVGLENARGYLEKIGGIIRKGSLSINQESRANVFGVGKQIVVGDLAREAGNLRQKYRYSCWFEQGKVEEFYLPGNN